jgi:threonylcarbamoyladenosine tRNA methylthiotransferase CDKAL1
VRVYVESYGCSQNQGEGAAIARSLVEEGHTIASAPEGADVGVLVSCAVIGSTESRMVRRWQALSEQVPRVVVTGCLVPLRTSLLAGPGRERTTFVPIREQSRLPEILAGWIGTTSNPPAPTIPEGPLLPDRPPVSEEIVIAQGCTSACSYCFSRLARGHLTSVSADVITSRARAAVARGVAELRLSSLDTSAWGCERDDDARLPDLMRSVADIPTDARVRVGMMSPQTLAPILDRFLDALTSERFYKFLHLPVQTGSDSLLAAMHRGYSVAEFRRQVDRARRRFPELTLATDVIVGYPGETEDDHHRTAELLQEVQPETVNVTRFSARPGTPAARLTPVGSGIAKRRSRELTELRRRQARTRLERWIGHRAPAIVLERGPGTSSVARLPNYLPVVLSERLELGRTLPIRVEGARSTYLLGRAEPASRTD